MHLDKNIIENQLKNKPDTSYGDNAEVLDTEDEKYGQEAGMKHQRTEMNIREQKMPSGKFEP